MLGSPLHVADAYHVMLLAEHGTRYDIVGTESGKTPRDSLFHELGLRLHIKETTLSDTFEKFCCLLAIGDRNFSSLSAKDRLFIDYFLVLHRDYFVSDVIFKSGYKPNSFDRLKKHSKHLILETVGVSDLRNHVEAHLSLERTASNALASSLRPNALVGVKSARLPPGYPWHELSLGVTKQNVQEGALKAEWLTKRVGVQYLRAMNIFLVVEDLYAELQ